MPLSRHKRTNYHPGGTSTRTSTSSGGVRTTPKGTYTTSPTTTVHTYTTPATETVQESTNVSLGNKKSPFDMSGIVLFLGITLIIAETATNGTLPSVWGFLFDPKYSDKNNQTALLRVSGMLVFVIILAAISSQNDTAAGTSILVLMALWVVWAVENPKQIIALMSKLTPTKA